MMVTHCRDDGGVAAGKNYDDPVKLIWWCYADDTVNDDSNHQHHAGDVHYDVGDDYGGASDNDGDDDADDDASDDDNASDDDASDDDNASDDEWC